MQNNQRAYILNAMVDIIVGRAADDLFNTPVASQVPTDSFAEDYEPDHMKAVEQDLQLENLE